MKRSCNFLLLIAMMAVAAVCFARERVAGPIGPGVPLPEDFKLAQSLEFTMERPYSEVRERLLTLSWQPDPSWGHSGVHEILSYPEYPEVLCGNGMDAVCTARLTKGPRAILLTINQTSGALPVVHVDWDD
jgi:hypothetical protein